MCNFTCNRKNTIDVGLGGRVYVCDVARRTKVNGLTDIQAKERIFFFWRGDYCPYSRKDFLAKRNFEV